MTQIGRIYTDWLMLMAIRENPLDLCHPCLPAAGTAGRRVLFLKFGTNYPASIIFVGSHLRSGARSMPPNRQAVFPEIVGKVVQ